MGNRANEEYLRVLDALRAHIRRHPLSVRELGHRMGVSRSYLPKLLAGKMNPSFKQLLEILGTINLSFSELATKSEGGDVEGFLEALLPQGSQDPPVILNLKKVARELVGRIRGHCTGLGIAVGAHLNVIKEADELRYSTPWPAARQALVVAQNVAPTLQGPGALEVFAQATAVLSSCYRIGGASHLAAKSLLVAFSVPGDFPIETRLDLIERAAYLLMTCDEHTSVKTTLLSVRSLEISSSSAERLDLARGVGLLFSGENDYAIESLLSVIPRLGAHPDRLMSAANTALGKAYTNIGKLEEASAALKEVELSLPTEDLYSKGMLKGALGSWWLANENHVQAEGLFEEAAEMLAPINPFDSALLILSRVETLFRAGRVREAVRAADQTIPLVDSLDTNAATANALKKFRLTLLAGKITLNTLKTCHDEVQAGRISGIRPALQS